MEEERVYLLALLGIMICCGAIIVWGVIPDPPGVSAGNETATNAGKTIISAPGLEITPENAGTETPTATEMQTTTEAPAPTDTQTQLDTETSTSTATETQLDTETPAPTDTQTQLDTEASTPTVTETQLDTETPAPTATVTTPATTVTAGRRPAPSQTRVKPTPAVKPTPTPTPAGKKYPRSIVFEEKEVGLAHWYDEKWDAIHYYLYDIDTGEVDIIIEARVPENVLETNYLIDALHSFAKIRASRIHGDYYYMRRSDRHGISVPEARASFEVNTATIVFYSEPWYEGQNMGFGCYMVAMVDLMNAPVGEENQPYREYQLPPEYYPSRIQSDPPRPLYLEMPKVRLRFLPDMFPHLIDIDALPEPPGASPKMYREMSSEAPPDTTPTTPEMPQETTPAAPETLPERTPEFTPEEPILEPTEVEDSLIEEEPEPQFGSNSSPMVESDAARAVDENLSSEQDVPPISDEPVNETER